MRWFIRKVCHMAKQVLYRGNMFFSSYNRTAKTTANVSSQGFVFFGRESLIALTKSTQTEVKVKKNNNYFMEYTLGKLLSWHKVMKKKSICHCKER